MTTSRANRELTTDDKTEVVKYLQDRMSLGKLPHGSIKAGAAALNLNRKTVSGIWKDFLTQGSSPSKKAGRVGRKLRYTPEHVTQLVQELPQEERSTMRDIATATGLTMGTICRNLKSGTLERWSSRLKPLLTDENRTERIEFCRSDGSGLAELPFLDMHDVVHLDEKWFNADKDRRKVYLTKGERIGRRACKSKRFIPKGTKCAIFEFAAMTTSRANRELTTDDKTEVVKYLQDRMSLGKLPHGSIKAGAAALNLNRKTVSGIWKDFLTQGSSPSKKAGRVGRKLRYTPEHVTQLVQELPQEERSTMRDIATATGLTMGTICRNLKSGTLERRSSRLKPLLTDENRTERIEFCRSDGSGLAELPFLDMHDVVHLDEKWFNADKDRRKVYLTKGERIGRRACKSKRFIPKVMFLAAVARPQYDDAGNLIFDGKIGMWPFVTSTPAIRTSRNRPAGTIYGHYSGQRERRGAKMPSVSKRVVIQHDNASPHASVSDGVLDAIQGHFADGWEFRVRRQPPNSPDLNVLDLGFFASIQALQYKSVSRTVDDVIRSTLAAFDELSEEKLDNVFLTLQAVMRIVLEHNGDNHFRLPHLHKEAMRRAGTLVANVACPVSLL
ncbi:hypothetical protein H257_15982 [Aphanomyces astaci]|uniref:Transposase Tc1-like domain-containing protein n=2 Tax=Aphanomyces astaci TaxID=112090 RepID=W4FMD0_APHAT|nr:hypothetical protein H257_15982 [Aphanomyces astaci]ETV67858.1 hypothetical protein H257_15982 [Aphanomyces astaci]|eukprot:XP_009842603.1 hypothetical protein H257_15982 [Aphanomyces astaci]